MNAKKYGWSDAEYTRRIRATYEKERIARRIQGQKESRLNPWDLLRKYEDRYKDSHPAYESPDVRKRSFTRDFSYGALSKLKKRRG
jgi:hypothetical protein